MQQTNTPLAKMESGFLSCLMTCPSDFVDEIRGLVKPEDMYLEPNKVLLRVIYAAHDATNGKNRGTAIILSTAGRIKCGDQKTLLDEFTEYGIDSQYLDAIEAQYIDTTTGRQFAQDIKDGSTRRSLAELSRKIYSISKSTSPDFKSLAEMEWGRFANQDTDDLLKHGYDLTERLWEDITGETKETRISLTSMGWLDAHMGIVGGRYYLLAMPPHVGKSLVVKNIAIQAALTSNIIPILFLYEESPEEAALSFISMLTGPQAPWVLKGIPEPKNRPTVHKKRLDEMMLDQKIVERMYDILRAQGQNVTYQRPTPMEMTEMSNAKTVAAGLSYLAMSAPSSIEEMRAIVRKVASKNPGKHIVPILDYIQLATAGSDTYREIGHISRNVKQSCLRDGGEKCPVSWFVLSQFNRTHGTSNLKKDVTMEKSPRQVGLTLDSLAESPALAQDPDVIIFGYNPSKHAPETEVAAMGLGDWTQLNYSLMKNRVTNQFPDGKIYFNNGNGWTADLPSLRRIQLP